MNKKIFALALLTLVLCGFVSAQQITKFGVVDTSRVYEAYFRDTGPVRNYEKKKADFQKQIDSLTQELKDLQAKRAEALKNKNEATVQRLDSQITKQTEYLKEYTNAKNMELDSLRRSLQSSDSFYQKLYSTLERIAEGGGYSMILSLQDSNSILWYSPSVDVTDEVISALGL
ncbi:MAG: OmpH family outer membrane protein [Spirochaetaceae bacterium]|nr:OmpH family outer membrane protein [Spirochaetaceae bacterium]MBQ8384605.1 OmpH family outer membrane protein [Spirochaetaceae bacterium]MBQ8560873.1 OmpH family outer membrane protein [Spirochaetaceae bacterium]